MMSDPNHITDAMPRRRARKTTPSRLSPAAFTAMLGQAWKASTIAGLILVFGYFVQYRYSPIDSLGSVSGLASLVAVLAVILGTALFATWTYPAGLLLGLAKSDSAPQLRQLFGVPEPTLHGPAPRGWRSVQRPMLVGLSWVMLPWMAMFVMLLPEYFGSDWLSRALAGGLALAAVLGWVALLKGRSHWTEYLAPGALALLAVALLVGPLFAFLHFASVGTYARVDDGPQIALVVAAAGALLSVEVVLYGVWVLRDRGGGDLQLAAHVGWTVGAFFLLMTGLGAGGGIVDAVMATTSVRVPHARLVLAPEACEGLEALAGVPPAQAASAAPRGPCTLRNVLVVSRIGEQWRLGCPGKDREGVVVDAKHVRVWASGDETRGGDTHFDRWCASVR